MEFKNLEKHSENGVLAEEEIGLVLEVVKSALGPDVGSMAGAVILDGQADGKDAECVVRFDLPEGSYTSVTSYNIGTRQSFSFPQTSYGVAEASIDAVLAWPKVQVLRNLPNFGGHGLRKIPTGIYDEGEYNVLVLNTDGGRFLLSVKALWLNHVEESAGYARMTMYLIARILGEMRPNDKMLQVSLEMLDAKAYELERFGPMLDELYGMEWIGIKQRLKVCDEPEFQAWKDWRERASAENEMTVYFR